MPSAAFCTTWQPWVSDPAWKSEYDAIQPFAWQLAKSSKGTWGVPVLGAVYNIFVNLDLLNAAGVADSWNKSYPDMMAAAKATTKGDVFGVSLRTRVADFAFWDWFPYIHNAGADILNKDWTGERSRWRRRRDAVPYRPAQGRRHPAGRQRRLARPVRSVQGRQDRDLPWRDAAD